MIALPGEAVEHANFMNIIHDISLLCSLGVKVVVIHGARSQIDKQLSAAKLTTPFHNSLRITDSEALKKVMQAIGTTRFSLEAAFSTGLPNSPMHGADLRVIGGNFVVARPQGIRQGVDFQYTGEVRKIHSQAIKQALDLNALALLSPLGYSPTGEAFNLSFSDVAIATAKALDADKFVLFGDEMGALNSQGQLERELDLDTAELLLKILNETDDLAACVAACKQGVPRCHLISYQHSGALLKELYSRDGSGTLIHSDVYQTIRSATVEDVGGIIELIEPLEKQGVLIRRSRELLEAEIRHFAIAERDGAIIGCAALYPNNQESIGELACLATHPQYRNAGHAKLLLKHVEKQAKAIGLKKIFVLTTQTAHWFQEHGFTDVGLDELPDNKQAMYNYSRNSKPLIKRF